MSLKQTMLDALVVAREFISIDRNSLADSCIRPDGTFDEDDAAAIGDYDLALLQIDEAIQLATGGKGFADRAERAVIAMAGGL